MVTKYGSTAALHARCCHSATSIGVCKCKCLQFVIHARIYYSTQNAYAAMAQQQWTAPRPSYPFAQYAAGTANNVNVQQINNNNMNDIKPSQSARHTLNAFAAPFVPKQQQQQATTTTTTTTTPPQNSTTNDTANNSNTNRQTYNNSNNNSSKIHIIIYNISLLFRSWNKSQSKTIQQYYYGSTYATKQCS
jgi:hypothetical protein